MTFQNSNKTKYKVSIIGASGYAGGEVLRLLINHPQIDILHLMGDSSANTKLTDHHSEFINVDILADRKITEISSQKISESDILFLALPHGISNSIVKQLKQEIGQKKYDELIILDLGADFRLKNKDDWDEYYHPSQYSGEFWTYGLPQIVGQTEKLKTATKIAVPGCNATAVTLGLLPLSQSFEQFSSQNSIIEIAQSVNAVLSVGYTGAGRSLKPHLLASESFNNIRPYNIMGKHRHIPEILQNINIKNLKLNFTPVLVPVSRGILAIITLKLNNEFIKSFSQCEVNNKIHELYKNYYHKHNFVKVLNQNVLPTTMNVVGSNYTQICVGIDSNTNDLTVIVALDNLIKGTAGGAIESMNLALGLEFNAGLNLIGQMR